MKVELVAAWQVHIGAAVLPNRLKVGDTIVCHRKKMKVKAVTGGGMKEKVYGGRDFIVCFQPFDFNTWKVVCPP